jgi:hypothetical protein
VLLGRPAEVAGEFAGDAIGPARGAMQRGAMHDQRGRGRAAHGFTHTTTEFNYFSRTQIR